jgi:hypothetical protein
MIAAQSLTEGHAVIGCDAGVAALGAGLVR